MWRTSLCWAREPARGCRPTVRVTQAKPPIRTSAPSVRPIAGPAILGRREQLGGRSHDTRGELTGAGGTRRRCARMDSRHRAYLGAPAAGPGRGQVPAAPAWEAGLACVMQGRVWPFRAEGPGPGDVGPVGSRGGGGGIEVGGRWICWEEAVMAKLERRHAPAAFPHVFGWFEEPWSPWLPWAPGRAFRVEDYVRDRTWTESRRCR